MRYAGWVAIALTLVCASAAAAAPGTCVRVQAVEAPRGRVHTILTAALSPGPWRHLLFLADEGSRTGPATKWCFVLAPTGDGYNATAVQTHALPLDAALAQCGDLDGDGLDDLTYVTRSGAFALMGQAGGFAPAPRRLVATATLVPPGTDRIVEGHYLADVTGDGRLDLLLPVDAGLHLYPQTADGDFAPVAAAVLACPLRARMYGGLGQTWITYRLPRVTVSDYDADGRMDVTVCDVAGSFRFHQEADGRFQALRVAGDLSQDADNSFTMGRFGDWNGDGNPDAALTRMEQRRAVNTALEVYLGAADGRLPTTPTMRVDAASTILFPLFLDATGDGRSELLLYRIHFGLRFALNYFLRDRIQVDAGVYQFGPDGRYPAEPTIQRRITVDAFETGAEPVRTVADVNGDGAMDVVVGTSAQTLAVYLGDPVEILSDGPAWTVAVESYGVASVADVNGDGRDDLLITYPEPERQQNVSVVLSCG